MITFYLDNTQVSSPTNWRDLESILRNDEEVGGVIISEESNFTWADDGYAYLQLIADAGFCGKVELIVKDDSQGYLREIIRAYIFVSDITFNERECTATAKIQDQSFFAMINNNRSVNVGIESNLSKNQDVLAPATIYNLDVYSQSNVLYQNNCRAYRIYEVMKTIIAFITDNRIGFESSLFEVGGEWEGLCITTGFNLRTGTAGEFTQINFEDCIAELNSLMPVSFIIEDPYVSPVFRLEKRDYFKGNGTVLTIDDIYEIKRSYDRSSLYTSVNLGSSVTDSDATLNFPETIKFLGYYDEIYTLLGECNINRTLNLVGNWVRSNNIIQRIITGDQGYDDNIIIFESILTDATNGRTLNTNFLNLNPAIFFYNENLTNTKIADRYESWIPNSIASNYGQIGDGIFKAFVNATINVGVGTYLNLSLNTTNVWQNVGSYFNGTDRFTAAFSGVFRVRFYLEFNNIVITGANPVWALGSSMRQFDSTGTLVNTITLLNPSYGNDPTDKILDRTIQFVMNQGDYIEWQVGKTEATGTDVTGDITTNTFWECEENTIGGGIFKDYNPDDYQINLYEFTYPMTCDQWNDLIASPLNKIQFRSHGAWRTGYVNQIKYNHVTGISVFKLIQDSNAN